MEKKGVEGRLIYKVTEYPYVDSSVSLNSNYRFARCRPYRVCAMISNLV